MSAGRFHVLASVAVLAAALVAAGAVKTEPRDSGTSSPLAVEWLTKAVTAPDRVSYRATETMATRDRKGRRTRKVRVVHRMPDDTRREYLSKRGRVQLIVCDDGRSHWEYWPPQKKIVFSPSLPADRELWQERHIDDLLANYTVRHLSQATMDGRKVRLLAIAPRRGHDGPSKRLSVDEQTGLILSAELTSSDGKTALTSRLSDLRFERGIPGSEFTPPAKPKRQHVMYEQAAVLPLRHLSRQWNRPLIVPKYLPRGYRLESARLVRRGRYTFVHLRYFDGLNTVSLFEDTSRASRGDPSSRRKDDRVQGAAASWKFYAPFWSLNWRQRDLRLTLVGDLPRQELLRMARGTSRFSR